MAAEFSIGFYGLSASPTKPVLYAVMLVLLGIGSIFSDETYFGIHVRAVAAIGLLLAAGVAATSAGLSMMHYLFEDIAVLQKKKRKKKPRCS